MTDSAPDADTAGEPSAAASDGRLAIGVDVGGSGIKAAVVDTSTGRLVSERLRVPTPKPSTPDKVSATIGRLVRRLVKSARALAVGHSSSSRHHLGGAELRL